MKDDMTLSYWDCLNSGMTQAETAKARGVSVTAASNWERRSGKRFKREKLRAHDIPEAKQAEYAELMKSRAYRRDEVLEILGLEHLA